VRVLQTKLRQPPHGDPVLLVNPRKLQPEFALRDGRSGIPAGYQHSQRRIAVGCQFLHCILQGAELIQYPARKQFHVSGLLNLRTVARLQIPLWFPRAPRSLHSTCATRFAARPLPVA
jgi:hypothetical protein